MQTDQPNQTTELDNEHTPDTEQDTLDPNMVAQVQEMVAKLEKAEELEREVAELKNKYARLLADFENYRRRTNQDVLDAENKGIAKATEALFPIMDDLARAVEFGHKNPESILSGLSTVQSNLLRSFEQLGLEQTGAKGETFNPAYHEALQVLPGPENDVVLEVFQVGFKLGDRLIRPARVIVSKADLN